LVRRFFLVIPNLTAAVEIRPARIAAFILLLAAAFRPEGQELSEGRDAGILAALGQLAAHNNPLNCFPLLATPFLAVRCDFFALVADRKL
jgi:hypothetical protein